MIPVPLSLGRNRCTSLRFSILFMLGDAFWGPPARLLSLPSAPDVLFPSPLQKAIFPSSVGLEDDFRCESFYGASIPKDGEFTQKGICHPRPVWQVFVQAVCGEMKAEEEMRTELGSGVLASPWESSSGCREPGRFSRAALQSCGPLPIAGPGGPGGPGGKPNAATLKSASGRSGRGGEESHLSVPGVGGGALSQAGSPPVAPGALALSAHTEEGAGLLLHAGIRPQSPEHPRRPVLSPEVGMEPRCSERVPRG